MPYLDRCTILRYPYLDPQTSSSAVVRDLGSLNAHSTCDCGCILTSAEGRIVTSSKCRGSVLWFVAVAEGRTVRLRFHRFDLDADNPQTWVKIRDGDSHLSTLLLDSRGGDVPRPVTSSQNKLLVEYMAPYNGHTEGFVASYTSLGRYAYRVYTDLSGYFVMLMCFSINNIH